MTTTEPTSEVPFTAVLCVEGVTTGDGRYLEPGTGSWRELPQPLKFVTATGPGHDGAEPAAVLRSIRMDGRRMMGEGVLFADIPEGAEAIDMIAKGLTRFVSIDMATAVPVIEPIFDDDGEIIGSRTRFGPYRIMGATICDHPAFEQSVIWLQSEPAPPEFYAELPEPLGPPVPFPDIGEMLLLASGGPASSLVASGASLPPLDWFANPQLTEPTPLEITDAGRVFGHIAAWDCCHIGYLDDCVPPPRGTDYSRFLVGARRTSEGVDVPTGTMTAFGGHADDRLNAAAATRHYDDVTVACADVNVGEDVHGIWISGAVRSSITDAQIEVLRGSAPSGDWRPIRGHRELINIHFVNTPGYPVPRLRAVVADGRIVSLTAAAVAEEVARDEPASTEPNIPDDQGDSEPVVPTDPVEERLAKIEHAISPLLESQRDEILARHPAPPEPSPLEQYLASRES